MKHAQLHNILYDLQHGFRSCVSCETHLIKFTHDLVTNMQSGAQTDVIVIDFSKAFDKVSHTKLFDKRHHYGIQGKTNVWFKEFLTDRSKSNNRGRCLFCSPCNFKSPSTGLKALYLILAYSFFTLTTFQTILLPQLDSLLMTP